MGNNKGCKTNTPTYILTHTYRHTHVLVLSSRIPGPCCPTIKKIQTKLLIEEVFGFMLKSFLHVAPASFFHLALAMLLVVHLCEVLFKVTIQYCRYQTLLNFPLSHPEFTIFFSLLLQYANLNPFGAAWRIFNRHPYYKIIFNNWKVNLDTPPTNTYVKS